MVITKPLSREKSTDVGNVICFHVYSIQVSK